MARALKVDEFPLAGAFVDGSVWVNHVLVADGPPPQSWSGNIPDGATPISIDVTGVTGAKYGVKVDVDNQVEDTTRVLGGTSDVFSKTV